jgi:hypothetical protein
VPLLSLSNYFPKMNDDYSYAATPQEALEEDHDRAVEFPESEILALAGPELEAPAAPKLSGPTVVSLFLL